MHITHKCFTNIYILYCKLCLSATIYVTFHFSDWGMLVLLWKTCNMKLWLFCTLLFLFKDTVSFLFNLSSSFQYGPFTNIFVTYLLIIKKDSNKWVLKQVIHKIDEKFLNFIFAFLEYWECKMRTYSWVIEAIMFVYVNTKLFVVDN